MKASHLALLVALTVARQAFAGTGSHAMLDASLQQQCAWPSRNEAARIYVDEADWRTSFPVGTTEPFSKAPDWKTQRVIVLTLGARPSSGFAIELADKHFNRSGDVLSARFSERKPAPGDMQEQAFTQPCVFVLVGRRGWRTVVFHNTASGQEIRASAAGSAPHERARSQR